MKIWQKKLEDLDLLNNFMIFIDDIAWITILDKIYQRQLSEFKNKVILSSEINLQWFADNLQNLNFFSEKTKWNILNSEKILATLVQKIESDFKPALAASADTKMWFFFNSKPKAQAWKKLDLISIEIDKLARWDEKSCLMWLAKIWEIDTSEFQKHWPFDSELTLSQHVQLLEMVGTKVITCMDAKSYFEQTSFEGSKFELLDILEKRALNDFWNQLKVELSHSNSLDSVKLIQFNKNHLLKMANAKDNSGFVPKNNFEKKMAHSASGWPKKDILRLIKLFSEWEILAKSGDSLQLQVAQELLAVTK